MVTIEIGANIVDCMRNNQNNCLIRQTGDWTSDKKGREYPEGIEG